MPVPVNCGLVGGIQVYVGFARRGYKGMITFDGWQYRLPRPDGSPQGVRCFLGR